jgi:long-chain fatty acid transport protein
MAHELFRKGFLAAAGFLALLFAAAGAQAQPETVPRFDFSFSNPGARSLGFGGAFAALADDATAAYANPAGLVQLTEPEVSLEARHWSRSTSFVSGGRLGGEPTGLGLDTRQGLVFGGNQERELGASFASVVIPKGRWSFALYGHQLAKFQARTESQGAFFEDEDGLFRIPATRESVDLEAVTGGMAAAWRMNDRLSFGLGLVFSDVSLKTSSEIFLPDDDSLQSLFGPISFLPERSLWRSVLDIGGSDVTFNAGALARISEQVSAGLFYRQGANVEGVDYVDYPEIPGLPVPSSFRMVTVFNIPDVAGAGLAYRSSDGRVTIATEADWVGYAGMVRVKSTDLVTVITREFEDAWEYHLGAEYALLQSRPILAIRAGAWIESNGYFIQSGNLVHYSAGLGIAAQPFQIDLAGDFSKRTKTASLSLIYTF